MGAAVVINGRIAEAGAISVFDAGFQHAVALFETFLGGWTGDRAWGHFLDDHLGRLTASARALALSTDLRADALRADVSLALEAADLEVARVRVCVTGGSINMVREGPGRHEPGVIVVAQPATTYPEAMFERGVAVTIADARANPFNPVEGHKTPSYWWRLRELQVAAAKQAAEAIVLSITNHVTGGCVSNLVCIKGGQARTPIARGEEGPGAVPSATLPGVTRGRILGWCEPLGVSAQPSMMGIADVLDADEVFLTNSSWGVLPVTRVESRQIGAGEPGKVTRQLRREWVMSLVGARGDSPPPLTPPRSRA